MVEVILSVTGLVSKSLGFTQKTVTVEPESTVRQVLQEVGLEINVRWLIVSINGKKGTMRSVLEDGDYIKILPICGGG